MRLPFINPCQPTVASKPPSGPGWAHELKHDGYRLQIHVRDGRVRLYTMNGADWSHSDKFQNVARLTLVAAAANFFVCQLEGHNFLGNKWPRPRGPWDGVKKSGPALAGTKSGLDCHTIPARTKVNPW